MRPLKLKIQYFLILTMSFVFLFSCSKNKDSSPNSGQQNASQNSNTPDSSKKGLKSQGPIETSIAKGDLKKLKKNFEQGETFTKAFEKENIYLFTLNQTVEEKDPEIQKAKWEIIKYLVGLHYLEGRGLFYKKDSVNLSFHQHLAKSQVLDGINLSAKEVPQTCKTRANCPLALKIYQNLVSRYKKWLRLSEIKDILFSPSNPDESKISKLNSYMGDCPQCRFLVNSKGENLFHILLKGKNKLSNAEVSNLIYGMIFLGIDANHRDLSGYLPRDLLTKRSELPQRRILNMQMGPCKNKKTRMYYQRLLILVRAMNYIAKDSFKMWQYHLYRSKTNPGDWLKSYSRSDHYKKHHLDEFETKIKEEDYERYKWWLKFLKKQKIVKGDVGQQIGIEAKEIGKLIYKDVIKEDGRILNSIRSEYVSAIKLWKKNEKEFIAKVRAVAKFGSEAISDNRLIDWIIEKEDGMRRAGGMPTGETFGKEIVDTARKIKRAKTSLYWQIYAFVSTNSIVRGYYLDAKYNKTMFPAKEWSWWSIPKGIWNGWHTITLNSLKFGKLADGTIKGQYLGNPARIIHDEAGSINSRWRNKLFRCRILRSKKVHHYIDSHLGLLFGQLKKRDLK